MKFRNLDTNNDWTFGAGLANYASNNDAIGINIKTRVSSWLNDCFFDLDAGIDWINRLGQTNQLKDLEDDLRKIIIQTEGVTKLTTLTTVVTNRVLTISYNVQTQFSQSYQSQITQGV